MQQQGTSYAIIYLRRFDPSNQDGFPITRLYIFNCFDAPTQQSTNNWLSPLAIPLYLVYICCVTHILEGFI